MKKWIKSIIRNIVVWSFDVSDIETKKVLHRWALVGLDIKEFDYNVINWTGKVLKVDDVIFENKTKKTLPPKILKG